MTTRMADIEELIRQAACQPIHPRVCEALMLAYYDFVYHLANSFLGDPDEAEDAAQETFLQAALHIDQYQSGTNLKSWLARITLNHCRARYRRQKMRQRLENVLKIVTLQLNPSLPTPEDALVWNERQRSLKQAVDSLDEKHRLPVLLRYVHGLSVPEIAQALDEKEGTIYSRLHYANRKLRDQLGDLAAEECRPAGGDR